jgi:hypothetical protein
VKNINLKLMVDLIDNVKTEEIFEWPQTDTYNIMKYVYNGNNDGSNRFGYGFFSRLLDQNNINYEYINSIKSNLQTSDKKWIYLMDVTGGPDTWFGSNPNSLLSGVSDNVLTGVRDNNGIIVLYASYEGFDPVWFDIFKNINKELEDKKIPLANFCYVTGDQKSSFTYKEWCEANNIKDKFNVICYNDEEAVPFYKNRINDRRFNCFKREDISVKPEKYFLCYNRRPHVHRMALVALLEKYNLIEDGLISFPDNTFSEGFPHEAELNQKLENLIDSNTPPKGWELMDGNEDTKKDILHYWNKLEKRLPLLVDIDTLDDNLWERFDIIPYKKTFFSIVVETLFHGNTIFLDEKVWKAIEARHPFVLVGNYHGLKKLKELGYKTFHPYINEEYDDIQESGNRMFKIIKEVKRLVSLSFSEWDNLLKKIDPILEYNVSWKKKRSVEGVNNLITELDSI